MTGRLEIISDVGLFCRALLFFSVHISADSCTLNLLYVISKLSCKIDQRELEYDLNLCFLKFDIQQQRTCIFILSITTHFNAAVLQCLNAIVSLCCLRHLYIHKILNTNSR